MKSEKTLRALVRVGQAVSLAVERFVTVGEKIAEENPEIAHDMWEACRDAKSSGRSRMPSIRRDCGSSIMIR